MFRWLPVVILVAGAFMFLPNFQQPKNIMFTELENGCLVYAIHMKMMLDAQERLEPFIWTRTIAIQFNGRLLGHAILAFVYKNVTFVYDPAQGSFVAAMYPLYDAQAIAEIAYPKLHVTKAAFIEPTLTLHYP